MARARSVLCGGLLDQLELTLEELEELGDRGRTLQPNWPRPKLTKVASFTRERPSLPVVPGTSASRAGDRAGTGGLHLLWRRAAVQARRGHHRDAGGGPEIPWKVIQQYRPREV